MKKIVRTVLIFAAINFILNASLGGYLMATSVKPVMEDHNLSYKDIIFNSENRAVLSEEVQSEVKRKAMAKSDEFWMKVTDYITWHDESKRFTEYDLDNRDYGF